MDRTFSISSCDQGEECRSSVEVAGFGVAKCGLCRLSPTNDGINSSLQNYWRPIIPGTKNKTAEELKKADKQARVDVLKEQRKNRDASKVVIQRKAAKAERTTEQNLIRATKNSGRANKDGDHLAADSITLDTKLQTGRDNPVVHIHELLKVNADAARMGKLMGALVLRNRHGVGVVAMREQDFALIVQRLM